MKAFRHLMNRFHLAAILCLISCGIGGAHAQSAPGDAGAGACDVLSRGGPDFGPLVKVCEYALASPRTLPNFVCTERVKRHANPKRKPDLITAELTFENMKSRYDDVTVNGKEKGRYRKSQDAVFEEEAIITGEFAMLFNVFDSTSRAEFSAPVDERIAGRRVKRYDFRVRRENNAGWTWFFVRGAVQPGYQGSVFVEPASGKISRLRVVASDVGSQSPVSEQTTTLDYGDVAIQEAGTHRVPVRGETVSCFRQLFGCVRFELSFDNFHKFGASTRIIP